MGIFQTETPLAFRALCVTWGVHGIFVRFVSLYETDLKSSRSESGASMQALRNSVLVLLFSSLLASSLAQEPQPAYRNSQAADS